MKFIDEVSIIIKAGKGGNGASSFRREKYIPFGGPDGGHGGNGGSIYFIADENINTLSKFRGRKNYDADDGVKGAGRQKNGHAGEDLYIRVPVGTLIKDDETRDLLCDLHTHDMTFLAAKGGRGGLGNSYFKTSTNQAPRYAQVGDEGETRTIYLELKLLADIGLVGFPNAGKSTLISVISDARPKIADYPFTTLEPNLGVYYDLILADIPGLIEGASAGKGLGIKFLRHVERTKVLFHLVSAESEDPLKDYYAVIKELMTYNEELLKKPEYIFLAKSDLIDEKTLKAKMADLKKAGKPVKAISIHDLASMEEVKKILNKLIEEKQG